MKKENYLITDWTLDFNSTYNEKWEVYDRFYYYFDGDKDYSNWEYDYSLDEEENAKQLMKIISWDKMLDIFSKEKNDVVIELI